MQAATDVNSAELARAMTALVRAFGLHRPEETPCGEPITVAEAHTLIDLSEINAWPKSIYRPAAIKLRVLS